MHFGFLGIVILLLLFITQTLFSIYSAAADYRAQRDQRAAEFFRDVTGSDL